LCLLDGYVLAPRVELYGCVLYAAPLHRSDTIQSYSVSHGMKRAAALFEATQLGALLVNRIVVRVVAAG
jgi:hypothetical protein